MSSKSQPTESEVKAWEKQRNVNRLLLELQEMQGEISDAISAIERGKPERVRYFKGTNFGEIQRLIGKVSDD